MAKQTVNIGTSANDGTGDPLRTAFDKINDNFDELYTTSAVVESDWTVSGSWNFTSGDLEIYAPSSALPSGNISFYSPSDSLVYVDLTAQATSGISAARLALWTYSPLSGSEGSIISLARGRGTDAAPSDPNASDVIGTIRWLATDVTSSPIGFYETAKWDCIYSSGGAAPVSAFRYRSGNGTSLVTRWLIDDDGGFVHYDASGTAASGGSQGAGTINAKAAYVDGVELGFRGIPQIAGSPAVIDADSVGKHIYTNDSVTVSASVYSVGDAVTIVNSGTGDITITQGTSVTMYLAGSATTGNRTLAQKGVATVLCVASNTFIISGAGLT